MAGKTRAAKGRQGRRSRAHRKFLQSWFGRKEPRTVGKGRAYLVTHAEQESQLKQLIVDMEGAEVVLCKELEAPGAIHRYGQSVEFFADGVKVPYQRAFSDVLRESVGKRLVAVVTHENRKKG